VERVNRYLTNRLKIMCNERDSVWIAPKPFCSYFMHGTLAQCLGQTSPVVLWLLAESLHLQSITPVGNIGS
jgi:hypothetical protein